MDAWRNLVEIRLNEGVYEFAAFGWLCWLNARWNGYREADGHMIQKPKDIANINPNLSEHLLLI